MALTILVFIFMVNESNAKEIITGVYGTCCEVKDQMFQAAKENGFDLVMSSDVAKAQSMGLKCLYPLEFTKEIANDNVKWQSFIDKVRTVVTKYNGNASVYGWYVADEPDWNELPPARYEELNAVIKSIDKLKPTIAVLTLPKKWHDYLRYFDIIAIDPYLDLSRTYKGRETDKVKDWINFIRRDFETYKINKPLWVVLGAFEQNLRYGKPAFRRPTPQEFNKMLEICLVNHVSGILVFSLFKAESATNYKWNLLSDDPLLWEVVRKLPHKTKDW